MTVTPLFSLSAGADPPFFLPSAHRLFPMPLIPNRRAFEHFPATARSPAGRSRNKG